MEIAQRALVLVCVALGGCGFALQRASVSRSFSGRFGCQAAKVTRAGDGYHVEGCGRSAEYVCVRDYDPGYGYTRTDPEDSAAEALGAVAFAALFAGMDEHCYLASAQRPANPAMPVASSAPAPVRRVRPRNGEIVLKTRVLFAGGHLSARAKPVEYPQHALLVVHGNARLPVGACRAEIFHDGVAVPVVDQLRPSAYEVQLLVPIRALEGVERAVRFAGSVCGLSFDLDVSSRATLGLFAVQFQEEVTRLSALTAGAGAPAATTQ
jgi:hypothetical protein